MAESGEDSGVDGVEGVDEVDDGDRASAAFSEYVRLTGPPLERKGVAAEGGTVGIVAARLRGPLVVAGRAGLEVSASVLPPSDKSVSCEL